MYLILCQFSDLPMGAMRWGRDWNGSYREQRYFHVSMKSDFEIILSYLAGETYLHSVCETGCETLQRPAIQQQASQHRQLKLAPSRLYKPGRMIVLRRQMSWFRWHLSPEGQLRTFASLRQMPSKTASKYSALFASVTFAFVRQLPLNTTLCHVDPSAIWDNCLSWHLPSQDICHSNTFAALWRLPPWDICLLRQDNCRPVTFATLWPLPP